jgi:hypothetical protein
MIIDQHGLSLALVQKYCPYHIAGEGGASSPEAKLFWFPSGISTQNIGIVLYLKIERQENINILTSRKEQTLGTGGARGDPLRLFCPRRIPARLARLQCSYLLSLICQGSLISLRGEALPCLI